MLTPIQIIVLKEIDKGHLADIREMSEPWRQTVISLGMIEPPLIDVEADQVILTIRGEDALKVATR